MKDKVVLLLSGGLDSTVLAYSMAREHDLAAVYIDYGQVTAPLELTACEAVAQELGIEFESMRVRFPASDFLGERVDPLRLAFPPMYFDDRPPRNDDPVVADGWTDPCPASLPIAAIAQSLGYRGLSIGVTASDRSRWPEAAEYFATLERLLNIGVAGDQFSIHTPLSEMSKSEVIRLGVSLMVPLERTTSCQVGRVQQCGICPGCRARRGAFEVAGITDTYAYMYG